MVALVALPNCTECKTFVMPLALTVTCRRPGPAGTTETPTDGRGLHAVTELNVAVTDRATFIVTVQLPVPEQAPPQPANVASENGVAVRDTTVPAAQSAT